MIGLRQVRSAFWCQHLSELMDTGAVVPTLPPPAERFDPITARWLTPGGVLHDPQRDSFDPHHQEPLKLVDPVPPELSVLEQSAMSDLSRSAKRSRRRRWILLAFVALSIAALVIGGSPVG